MFACWKFVVVFLCFVVICGSLWSFTGGLWSFVMVCGRLLMVCGGLWSLPVLVITFENLVLWIMEIESFCSIKFLTQ